jgi:hypothetical protein
MEFSKVVFYGRLGEQALKMFGLEEELERWGGVKVLDCPGGPGSLPALLRGHGCGWSWCGPEARHRQAHGGEAAHRRSFLASLSSGRSNGSNDWQYRTLAA